MYDDPIYFNLLSDVRPFWPDIQVLDLKFVRELEAWLSKTYYCEAGLNFDLTTYARSEDLEPYLGLELNRKVCELIPSSVDDLLVIWHWEASGIRVAKEVFCQILDRIWHPISHEVYVFDKSRSFMLLIHHEDIAYLWVETTILS